MVAYQKAGFKFALSGSVSTDVNMNNVTTVAGSEIQNLITKFYYKDNHLCFQILLHFGLDKTIPFKEFSDYSEYKRVYGELLQLKNSNAQIVIPVAERKNSMSSTL